MHDFKARLTFTNSESSEYKTKSIKDLIRWLEMSYDANHNVSDLGVIITVDNLDIYKGELNHVVILGIKQILIDNYC